MRVGFFALFIYIAGCWRSEQPKGNVQNVVSKEGAFVWLSRRSNTEASVQVRWYYSAPSLGIKSFEDGIGLVVDQHVVIVDGWPGALDGSLELEKIVILPLTKSDTNDEIEVHLVAVMRKHSAYALHSDLAILATSKTLPVKPVVFEKFSYSEHVAEGYRIVYTRNQGNFFDSGKAVPASVQFAIDTKTCRVDLYDWAEPQLPDRYYSNYGSLTGFDENHRLICFGGMSAQRVRKFLEKNHVSVLKK